MIESTKSEFSVVRWPKQVKHRGEKLNTPLVQNFKAKYSVQVKIFEVYPSGRSSVESIESEFAAKGWPKGVKNPGAKLYAPLVQSSKVPRWHPALCRVPSRHDQMGKIWKFSPGESILLGNFTAVVGKVSLQYVLLVLAALWPKIPIWYFQPGCNQMDKIRKSSPIERILLRNFAPVVRKVPLEDYFLVLIAENCDLVLSTEVHKMCKIWKFSPGESILLRNFAPVVRQVSLRIVSPFPPPYGQNFWFGTFNRDVTRWVKLNFHLERVFCFGTLHQRCAKFLFRTFYPFWPPYDQKFQFGTFDRGATRWYFWLGCDQKLCSVLSTVVRPVTVSKACDECGFKYL